MPNPNTIPTIRYQDIQIDDVELRQQFKSLMAAGNYTQAIQILTNNAQQLHGKAYIAETINTLMSGVLELESWFNTGVTVYLSNLATQYQNMINEFRRAGTWDSATAYIPYNFVVQDEELYMCIQETTAGIPVTNETYWLHLNIRGLTGVPGVDVVMRYNYNSGTTYQANDLVVYQGRIYVALQTTSGIDPTDTSRWLLFLAVIPGEIIVSTTAPEDVIDGTVWFQVESDPNSATDTTPILGQFNRYIESSDEWEIMYPNTLFELIDGTEIFAPLLYYEQLDIQVSQWVNNTFTYTNNLIGADSIIKILPDIPMTDLEYNLYNQLTISITGNSFTLTVEDTPAVPVGIRILIQ